MGLGLGLGGRFRDRIRAHQGRVGVRVEASIRVRFV